MPEETVKPNKREKKNTEKKGGSVWEAYKQTRCVSESFGANQKGSLGKKTMDQAPVFTLSAAAKAGPFVISNSPVRVLGQGSLWCACWVH